MVVVVLHSSQPVDLILVLIALSDPRDGNVSVYKAIPRCLGGIPHTSLVPLIVHQVQGSAACLGMLSELRGGAGDCTKSGVS